MTPIFLIFGANIFLSALNAALAAKRGDAFSGWLMATVAWLVAMQHALEGGAV
jgi:hypothetical protein